MNMHCVLFFALLIINFAQSERCILQVCIQLPDVISNCNSGFGNIFVDDYTCIKGDAWGISTNCKDTVKIGTSCNKQYIGKFGDQFIADDIGTRVIVSMILNNYDAHMASVAGKTCSVCNQLGPTESCNSMIGKSVVVKAGYCNDMNDGIYLWTDCSKFVLTQYNACTGNTEKGIMELGKCYYTKTSTTTISQMQSLNECSSPALKNSSIKNYVHNVNCYVLFIFMFCIFVIL